jgi:long-chain acyl-CoA synthetase
VKVATSSLPMTVDELTEDWVPGEHRGRAEVRSPLIGQAICIGEARPYNVALVVLDAEVAGMPVADAAVDPAIPARVTDAAVDPAIPARVADAVAPAIANLSRVEQIKRHAVLDVDWLPDGDELTATMKLKRKPIAARYAEQIEALYA